MDGQHDLEDWREVPETRGKYRVSGDGLVRSPTRILSRFPDRDGYLRVNLQYPEGKRQKVVHKLVAEAFIGPQPKGTEVQLIDGDKSNVRAGNLAYVPLGTGAAKATGASPPRGERASDGLVRPAKPRAPSRIGPGRPLRGEECGRAKLSEADALEILATYEPYTGKGSAKKKTATLQDIADYYGVARSTIAMLVQGKNWRHLHQGVADNADERPSADQMVADLEEALDLYERLAEDGALDQEDAFVQELLTGTGSNGLEQAKRYRQHRAIERVASHSKMVKAAQGHTCRGCDRKMSELYGDIASDMVEAHHLVPLASLVEGETVTFDLANDFAVLCPNCHRAIHRLPNPGDLGALRRLIQSHRHAC